MASRAAVIQVVENFVGDPTTSRTLARKDPVSLQEKLRSASDWLVSNLKAGKIKPEEVHIGQLWESFVNTGERLGPTGCAGEISFRELYEATGASEFPKITTALIHQKLIPTYQAAMQNYDNLVDEVDSDKPEETIAGVITPDEPKLTLEKMPISEGQMVEKYVRIKNYKFTRKISLTREAVLFDKTGGQLLRDARDYGEAMARHRIRFMIQKIIDVAVDATGESAGTALNYKGTAYAVYSNDHSSIDGQMNDNTITGAFGTTAINNAMATLAKMKDYWGKELNLTGRQFIVPVALQFKALQAVASPGQFDSANRASNPLQLLGGAGFEVYSHPILDANSTTAWYFGDFRRNYRWQWVIRPRVEDMPGDPSRDVLSEFLGIWFGGCGAVDYRYAVKSSGV